MARQQEKDKIRICVYLHSPDGMLSSTAINVIVSPIQYWLLLVQYRADKSAYSSTNIFILVSSATCLGREEDRTSSPFP